MSIVVWKNGEIAIPSHVIDDAGYKELQENTLMQEPTGGENWTINGVKVLGFTTVTPDNLSITPFLKERLLQGLTHHNPQIDTGSSNPDFEVFLFTEDSVMFHWWQSKLKDGSYSTGLVPRSKTFSTAFGDGAIMARAVLSIGKDVKKALEIAIGMSVSLTGHPVIYKIIDKKLVKVEG